MSVYPQKVQLRSESPQWCGKVESENASGTDASFICGSFVRFSIRIDSKSKRVSAAGFETNGCGYMIAAADVLGEAVEGRHLADLHGLIESELRSVVGEQLGEFESGRSHCALCCIEALRSAFADYRRTQIEEFRGEKALICTCFGVAEETIEKHIAEENLETVEDVTRVCNAGGGCGSCRMLVQEIIDSYIPKIDSPASESQTANHELIPD